jgi:hypothetical protein
MSYKPHIVFFGHHKCGSRFFRLRVLEPLAEINGYEVVRYNIGSAPFHHSRLDELDMKNTDFSRLDGDKPIMLLLANSSPRVVGAVMRRRPDFLGLHVVRDPRQVWVSNYFHHRDRHQTESKAGWVWDRLIRDRPILRDSPLEEGLRHELRSITRDVLAGQIEPWRTRPNTLEVKLEEFVDAQASDHPRVQRVVDHLGLIPQSQPYDLMHSSNASSKPWQDVLTPPLKAAFKRRYGLLLTDLGYEDGMDW